MATRILEIPTEFNALFESLEKLLSLLTKQRTSGLDLSPIDYRQFEMEISRAMGGIERGCHDALLGSLDVDQPSLLIDGKKHVRVESVCLPMMTRAGEVQVLRTLYLEEGKTDGPATDIVALRTNCVLGNWLPKVAESMAFLLHLGTGREAETLSSQLDVLPYSRSSFERVAHGVGSKYVAQHHRIEAQMIEEFTLPPKVKSVSVSLDRVSIPVEEPRKKPPGRPKKDAAMRPISRVFRMAYCGCVTFHDAHGEALSSIRYGTMPSGDAKGLCMSMADDVASIFRDNPGLKVSLLCDGAPEMWNLLSAEFNMEPFVQSGTPLQIIDFWHVIEKLSAAAKSFLDDRQATWRVAIWKKMLMKKEGAAQLVLDELKNQNMSHGPDEQRLPLHDAITYLTNNLHRMHYAKALREGLPIGSGNVEATCKSLVTLRMKRPGSRWKTKTGEHILHLRALALSSRWNQAMDILLKSPVISVQSAA